MTLHPHRGFLLIATLALLGAGAAGGCSSSNVEFTNVSSSLNCVDDTPQCVSSRQAALRTLVADKNRGWIRQPADASAHASGVRLFALRQKRRELTCDELAHGKREADTAPAVLRASAGRLTHAQISRGVILAGEVSRDLAREQAKRCART
jgi:hypothetical protein